MKKKPLATESKPLPTPEPTNSSPLVSEIALQPVLNPVMVMPLQPDFDFRKYDRQAVAMMPAEEKKKEMAQLAGTFRRTAYDAAAAYLELVQFVRYAQLPPEASRLQLLNAGLPKSRVSEISKVADAPEEVFNEYLDRKIGFKVALAKTRGELTAGGDQEAIHNRKWMDLTAQLIALGIKMEVKKFKEISLHGWTVKLTKGPKAVESSNPY